MGFRPARALSRISETQIFCTFPERSCPLARIDPNRHCQSAATWRVTGSGSKSHAARNVLQRSSPGVAANASCGGCPQSPTTKFLAKDPLSRKGRAGSNPAPGPTTNPYHPNYYLASYSPQRRIRRVFPERVSALANRPESKRALGSHRAGKCRRRATFASFASPVAGVRCPDGAPWGRKPAPTFSADKTRGALSPPQGPIRAG